MIVEAAWLAWGIVALLAFWRLPAAVAAAAVYLGGWLFLPVGHYPPGSSDVAFPFWITGAAVPSNLGWSKAAVIPVATLLGSLIFDRKSWVKLKPSWLDLPMLVWCAWPLLAALLRGALVSEDSTAFSIGAWSSLYVFASWGASWCVGRLYFASLEGRVVLMHALAWSALACLPLALIEGLFDAQLYRVWGELHPFRFDGHERYLGFRPIGMFEHGNQYGIWVALGALSALMLWLSPQHRERHSGWLAAVTAVIALAAQSIGALMLAALAFALAYGLRGISRVTLRRGLIASVSLAVVLAAIYASGRLPFERMARGTVAGQATLEALRTIGRGSFAWRVSQDQKVAPIIKQEPVLGHGTWNWWQPAKTRPWGLAMLILGQFGIIGCALMLAALLGPAVRCVGLLPSANQGPPKSALALSCIVFAAAFDALMNSFVYFPMIVAAGALAGTVRSVAVHRRSVAGAASHRHHDAADHATEPKMGTAAMASTF